MNRSKGYVLLVLLLMLLFAATLLGQLQQYCYFAKLLSKHMDVLVSARKSLSDVWHTISSSDPLSDCFFDSNNDIELDDFWASHSQCYRISSGLMVNYAFRQYHSADQPGSYLQYSLRVLTAFGSVRLRVVQEESSGVVTAWEFDPDSS